MGIRRGMGKAESAELWAHQPTLLSPVLSLEILQKKKILFLVVFFGTVLKGVLLLNKFENHCGRPGSNNPADSPCPQLNVYLTGAHHSNYIK